jgi:hypothetical protein
MAMINGTPGDDLLPNTVGEADTIDGGAGTDTASYANAGGGVLLDLTAGLAFDTVNLDFDTLVSIENAIGSAFDDGLFGRESANVLSGGGGDDTLAGQGGSDTFSYSFEVTEGGGGGETFTDFFRAHGGKVVDGKVAEGTSQGQFSSLYTKWLEMLVDDHGLGTKVLDLGQNSGINGTPVIAGMTGEFGERESFTWTSGSGKKTVTHTRWYSDTWSSGGGEDSITSNDGLDTILDFGTDDQLNFQNVTEAQFTAHFNVDADQDVNGDLQNDTVITINGFDGWKLTLSGFTGDLLATDAIVFSS